jgi:hypothetical protein
LPLAHLVHMHLKKYSPRMGLQYLKPVYATRLTMYLHCLLRVFCTSILQENIYCGPGGCSLLALLFFAAPCTFLQAYQCSTIGWVLLHPWAVFVLLPAGYAYLLRQAKNEYQRSQFKVTIVPPLFSILKLQPLLSMRFFIFLRPLPNSRTLSRSMPLPLS